MKMVWVALRHVVTNRRKILLLSKYLFSYSLIFIFFQLIYVTVTVALFSLQWKAYVSQWFFLI